MRKVLYLLIFIMLGFSVELLLSYDYPVVLYVNEYKFTSSLFVTFLLIVTVSAFVVMTVKFVIGTITLPNKIIKALTHEDPVKVEKDRLDKYVEYIAYGKNYMKSALPKHPSDPYISALCILDDQGFDNTIRTSNGIISDANSNKNLKFIAYKELAKAKLYNSEYDSALSDAKAAYQINQTPEVLSIILKIALETKNTKIIAENMELLEVAKYSHIHQLKLDASKMYLSLANDVIDKDKELATDYIKAALKYDPTNFNAIKFLCERNLQINVSNPEAILHALKLSPSFELFALYVKHNRLDTNPMMTLRQNIDLSQHSELYDVINSYNTALSDFEKSLGYS